MSSSNNRDEARKEYENAKELRMKLEAVAADKERAQAWNDLPYALELAYEQERLWLGRCIDPVENGSIDEQERHQRT